MSGPHWRLAPPGDPRMRRVLLAYGFAAFAEFATWLAILLDAYDRGGPALVGIASVSMLLPAVVAVPVLASRGDRIPRGRALSLAYIGGAVTSLFTGLLVAGGAPFWVILAGGACLTVAIGLVRPMHFAALPLIAQRPGDLVSANALSSSLDGVTLFTGFAVSGYLTQRSGSAAVLVGGGLLLVGAALLARGLGLPITVVADGDSPQEVRAALGGLLALRRSPAALILLAMMALTAVVAEANISMTVAFTDQVLDGSEAAIGLASGSYGVGIALGGALLAGLASRRRLAPLVVAGALTLGLAEAAIWKASALGPVLVLLIVAGLGIATIEVTARTLLQRTTDPVVLARVLAIQEGVALVGLMVGAVIGPTLVLWLGPARAFLPLGLAVAALGLSAMRALRSLEASARDHRREITLLSGVPFLAALPPFDLERLAQSSTWRPVAAGTVVVRQGDPGDSYYLVASGELSVEVDGVRRSHTLGRGDGFGEIALLRRIRRTATVTALSPCDLLVVESAAFLAAVTASPPSSALAQATGNRMLNPGPHEDPPVPA